MDQQGQSSNELIMDKNLQKMGKSHGGIPAASKRQQRSLLEPVQLDILMGNLEKTVNSEVNELLLVFKYSGQSDRDLTEKLQMGFMRLSNWAAEGHGKINVLI